MSSKKTRRRQARARQERKPRVNPATLFILFVAAALLALGVAAMVLGDGRGDPPHPGAVWSPEHGHWH
jgi:hypothetical protein